MSASWRLRPLRAADVRHLELWCEATPRGPLWEHAGSDAVAARLSRGEAAESVGRDVAGLLAGALEGLAAREGATSVWLGGGLTLLEGLAPALEAALSLPLAISPEGCFAGERGGRALLRRELGRDGVVVDVGQTGVKASGAQHRVIVARDRDRLPLLLIDPAHPPAPSRERREAVVELIGEAAGAVLDADADGAAAIVLALPGPLDAQGCPGPCSYGWQGDAELLPALLAAFQQAHPAGGELLLLNDAELAAESARAERALAPGERRLCATLGFGPGAALLG